MIPFPLSNRYSYLYGFGMNRLNTNGSLLVLAKSYELLENSHEASYKEEVALMPDKKNLVKARLYYYGHEIIPISTTELQMRSLFLVDP